MITSMNEDECINDNDNADNNYYVVIDTKKK